MWSLFMRRDAHRPENGNGRQFEKSRRLRTVNETAVELISTTVRDAKKDGDVRKNAVAV
jgi:hypothetical protein